MLILTRSQIAGLLSFGEYVNAVEAAFRAHAEGRSLAPGLMHVAAPEGEFHVKAGGLLDPEPMFALKSNGSFFRNRERYGLPNIQGMIVLADAAQGRPLAVMDSMEITIQRTGAATAIAARYLARPESSVAMVCGCGNQARIQLRAVCHSLPIRQAFAYSITPGKALAFAERMSRELAIAVEAVDAIVPCDVLLTCTPAKQPLVAPGDVRPGTFIAAVGADSHGKQELDARLTAASAVYGDLRAQCAAVGEFHYAPNADFRGELGELIGGKVNGRANPEEITIFDSTGTALQDVAAAVAVYQKARAAGIGVEIDLSK